MNYRQYALLVFMLGLGAMGVCLWLWGGDWGLGSIALLAATAALVGLTRAFPLKVSPQASATLAGAPVFVGVLLLSPFQAALAGAAGSLAADVYLKRRPLVAAFNIGVIGVAASLAAATFRWLPPDGGASLLRPTALGAAIASAAVLHTCNIGLMAGMLSLRKGAGFWKTRARTWVTDAVQEGGVLVLGLLAAILYQDAWWAAVLLAIPLLLAHVALGSSVKHAGENIALAAKLKEQMVDLKAAQAQLIQSAKMASVGTLAAGVAHEINNPLFVVSGKAELLLHDKASHLRTERAEQYLLQIHSEAMRAASIVKDLLSYSRSQTSVTPVDLSKAINVALDLVGKQVEIHGVRIVKQLDTVPPVQGRANMLQQVFINLLLNARDAMPRGGELVVRCTVAGDSVRVSVRDSGSGIPPEIRGHVFEPFVTTKDMGKGTGLELFICHRIVTEHGGRISIEDAPRGGTDVVIEIPAIKTPAPQPVSAAR